MGGGGADEMYLVPTNVVMGRKARAQAVRTLITIPMLGILCLSWRTWRFVFVLSW